MTAPLERDGSAPLTRPTLATPWRRQADPLADAPDGGLSPMPAELDMARRTYQVVGPAEASPIVFIHGTRRTRDMWRPQQVGLADAFRIVTVDLPGHGSAAGRRFRWPAAVDQVADVIDEAADGRAVVVGLSLGGYVAMELAARYPGRVAGLVVCGASVEPWTLLAEPLRAAARFVLALEVGDSPARWDHALARPRSILRAIEPRGFRRFRLDAGGQALLEIAGRRFRPRLATYPGPTLILNGACDRLIRRQEPDFLTTAQRGSLTVLPDAGHQANTDAPDAFNRAIRRFAGAADW